MIVRVPEFEIGWPSRSALLSFLGKAVLAAAFVAALVTLADWRLNSRMDRSGLEHLAAETATGSVAVETTAHRSRKH